MKMHYSVKKMQGNIAEGVYSYETYNAGATPNPRIIEKFQVTKKSDGIFSVKSLTTSAKVNMYHFSPCECAITQENLAEHQGRFGLIDMKSNKQIFNVTISNDNPENLARYEVDVIKPKLMRDEITKQYKYQDIDISEEDLRLNISIRNAKLQY